MSKFRVTAYATFEVVIAVDAENEEDAKRKAGDFGVSVCCHGSELTDGEPNDYEFILVSGESETLDIEDAELIEE